MKTHCTLKCNECGEQFIHSIPLGIHNRTLCELRSVPCRLASRGCAKAVSSFFTLYACDMS